MKTLLVISGCFMPGCHGIRQERKNGMCETCFELKGRMELNASPPPLLETYRMNRFPRATIAERRLEELEEERRQKEIEERRQKEIEEERRQKEIEEERRQKEIEEERRQKEIEERLKREREESRRKMEDDKRVCYDVVYEVSHEETVKMRKERAERLREDQRGWFRTVNTSPIFMSNREIEEERRQKEIEERRQKEIEEERRKREIEEVKKEMIGRRKESTVFCVMIRIDPVRCISLEETIKMVKERIERLREDQRGWFRNVNTSPIFMSNREIEEERRQKEIEERRQKEIEEERRKREIEEEELVKVEIEASLPSLLEEYQMKSFTRGICVILNIENFTYDPWDQDAEQFEKRVGSSRDRDTTKNTFTDLGFLVKIYDDLTAGEIVERMKIYALTDHSQYDCFVCVIMSHGKRDHIYGSDGVLVPIRSLTDHFTSSSCPDLSGKPKLFFIQACQGQDKQQGQEMERDNGDLNEDNPLSSEAIPNDPDFLIGGTGETGSGFIQKLCETLQIYAWYEDILHILTHVNNEVGNIKTLSTLRKPLLFQPQEVQEFNQFDQVVITN